MNIPETPSLTRLDHITPSLYEELQTCRAKAAWSTGGDLRALPAHPKGLLGVAFHVVMAAAQTGQLGDVDVRQNNARSLFDEVAASLHRDLHPLVRLKFPTTERLPYYNLSRERAALAARVASQTGPPRAPDTWISTAPRTGTPTGSAATLSERRLSSTDGVIVGRPDLLDVGNSEVVDYKTGQATDDPSIVSEREAMQLRLYAYLAAAAGIEVSRGTIVRGDGARASVELSKEAADREADNARQAMDDYNHAIASQSFEELAQPAPAACRSCPCIPLCQAFWNAADPQWFTESSVQHLEGVIVELEEVPLQGVPVATLRVEVLRGTIEAETAVLEQIPVSWFTADGDRGPVVGDVVRLVNGHVTHPDDPVIVRADRTTTSVWRIEVEHGSQPTDAVSRVHL